MEMVNIAVGNWAVRLIIATASLISVRRGYQEMRYEFDTEVTKTLPLPSLMAEKAVLFELYEMVRLLCDKKEEEMLASVALSIEKREATKTENKWINKRVAERRNNP